MKGHLNIPLQKYVVLNKPKYSYSRDYRFTIYFKIPRKNMGYKNFSKYFIDLR